jgi:hypothetical protein
MKSQCFPGIISTAIDPQHCSIIRNVHLCACNKLSSRPLGKIGAENAMLSYFPGTNSNDRGPHLCTIIRKLHPCACARVSSRSLVKVGAEIAVLFGNISTASGPEHCLIIRKIHLCACARLNSRSLGKLGAEIAVLSWNNFYCQRTTALFHNQETAPLRMRQFELSLSWQDRC